MQGAYFMVVDVQFSGERGVILSFSPLLGVDGFDIRADLAQCAGFGTGIVITNNNNY